MAIGNYIHYNYDNYLQHGLSVDGGHKANPNATFNKITADIRSKLWHRKKGLQVKELERQLNYYYSAVNAKQGIKTKLSPADIEQIKQQIMFVFKNELQGVRIDPKTLKAFVEGGISPEVLQDQEFKNKYNAIKSKIGTGSTSYFAHIWERVNFLLNDIYRQGLVTNQNLITKFQKIETEWNSIKQQAKEIINSSGGVAYSGTLDLSIASNRSFVDDINALIKGLLFTPKMAQGTYAEAIVAMVSWAVNMKAVDGTQEIIAPIVDPKKLVVGNKTSQKGIVTQHFDTRYVATPYLSKLSPAERSVALRDDRGGYFTGKYTKDKVDAYITLPSGRLTTASVKNISTSEYSDPEIHLLSGASVVSLLQDYDELLNHYLNVAGNPKKNGIHNKISASKSDQQTFENGRQAVRLAILLKAIEGGVWGQDHGGNIGRSATAELFIVNDNTNGRFHVYSVYDVINAATKDARLKNVKTGDFDKAGRIDNIWIAGSASAGAKDLFSARMRITNMLLELHKMKLDVSISKSALPGLI